MGATFLGHSFLLRLAALLFAAGLLAPAGQAWAQAKDRGQRQASIIFQILASELALAQGDIGVAAATYLNVARQTQDISAAKRATELAIEARAPKFAEEAAQIWLKAAPDDPEAQSTLDLLQIMTGQTEKLLQSLAARRNSAQAENKLEGFYDYVAGLAGRAPNKEDGLKFFEGVSKPHQNLQPVMYTRAMLYERVCKFDEMERILRELIRINPDHAHAHNALGYHFADRNERLDEAFRLIERALKLAPNDAHIIDSMGWVYFRMGKLDLAEKYLRQAHEKQPDAEISTHLGEVLWVRGREPEAEKLWRAAFIADPRNEVLLNTLKRLGISPMRVHPQ